LRRTIGRIEPDPKTKEGHRGIWHWKERGERKVECGEPAQKYPAFFGGQEKAVDQGGTGNKIQAGLGMKKTGLGTTWSHGGKESASGGKNGPRG